MKSIFILFLLLAPLTIGTRAQRPIERQKSVAQSAVLVDEKVCVVGAVVKPSEVTFTEGLTVTQAIKEAGGLLRGSKSTAAHVISGVSGGSSRVIYVDLNGAIKKRPFRDLELQPYDFVIVVPRNRGQRTFQPSINPCASWSTINSMRL